MFSIVVNHMLLTQVLWGDKRFHFLSFFQKIIHIVYLNFMGDNNVEQPCEHSVDASESECLTHRWRLSPSTSDVRPLQTWIVLENAREAVCVIMFMTFLSSFSMPFTRVSVQVQKMSLCCLPWTFKDSGGSKTLPVLFCRQHCC